MRTSHLSGPLFGWRAKAPTKAAALRELLQDGKFHTQQSMAFVAGHRFGSALFDIHNGVRSAAGEVPFHYERQSDPKDDSRVFYRMTDEAGCTVCAQGDRKRPSQVIAELRQEVAALRAKVARLEAGR